jgi:predicted phosphodiesterase
MQIAIISDIHGNLEALHAVAADIKAQSVDTILSLGDNIGYGPDPMAVIDYIREHTIPSVMGNHEMATVDADYLDWFNPMARRSLEKTIEMLSPKALKFISQLEPVMILDTCRCVHGFPPDSLTTYLFEISIDKLQQAFKAMQDRICFVGHTHILQIISFDGERITYDYLSEGRTALHEAHQYIINIGSVGQPRDGNNNAKYVIFDTEANTIEVRFVPYDIAAVVDKILAAGLPEAHANRLW